MYDKKEFPILVQLAPTDDDKEAALQTQIENNALVIKSLNADLKAVRASLAAAENRVKALEAENERLRNTLKPFANDWQEYQKAIVKYPEWPFYDWHYDKAQSCEDEYFKAASEALQTKEAE